MKRILLAVSGGIDSMYLANRASELIPDAVFAIAHCNFKLRGKESDDDEEFVHSWAEEHSVPFHCKAFNTEEYAHAKGISIEMAARELRYGWFGQLLEEEGYDAVAVAHNANDNAETMILNLLRGTGGRGLRGMSDREGIIRPMLGIGRAEIREWMESHNFLWREDRTNSDNVYKRNKIRNEVFPLFSQINPSFLNTLQKDMKHIAQENDIAEEYYSKALPEIAVDGNSINLKSLLEFKHWEYILWRWSGPYGLSDETFCKLVELLKSSRTISGKVFESPTSILSIHKKILSASSR